MSLFIEKQGKIEQLYFQAGKGKKIYLGRKNRPNNMNLKNILKALNYLEDKVGHYSDLENKLITMLPDSVRELYFSNKYGELYKSIGLNNNSVICGKCGHKGRIRNKGGYYEVRHELDGKDTTHYLGKHISKDIIFVPMKIAKKQESK